MKKDTLYERLLSDPPGDDLALKEADQEYQIPLTPRARVPLLLWIFVAFQTTLIVFLGVFITTHSRPDCPVNPVFPQVLYSPAQEALEYQPKTFKMGLGQRKAIYQQPPSKEVDQAWLDMYNAHGLSQIPKSQARLLPNKTLPIPADPDNYAVGLAVFHQLHCLDIIRQGLYPEHYTDPVTGAIAGVPIDQWPDHLGHCLENIRQSIVCASDISLVVWQWNDADDRASIMMNTVHSCRNFDKIVDWAKGHKRKHPFDYKVHVVDDIEIPTF